MSSSSSWDSVVDESAPLQNLNRTVIGSDILFSFSMGAALVRDVISSLPSPLYVIITDDIVHELYGRQLVRAFVDQGAVQQRDLGGRPAKGQKTDARKDAKKRAIGDRVVLRLAQHSRLVRQQCDTGKTKPAMHNSKGD
jgi:hypothetical protein